MVSEVTGRTCIKCGQGEVVRSYGIVFLPGPEEPDLFGGSATRSFTQREVEVTACVSCGQPYEDVADLPQRLDCHQLRIVAA